MDEQVVYWIGFFVALAFIVFGADDVLWDVFALFRGAGKKRVKLSLINEKPPKMLAVVIAAWHEDAVLGDELYYRILNHFVHCLNRLHAQ